MITSQEAEGGGHDPELSQFLEGVTHLSAVRNALGPDAFLEQVDELATNFQQLRKYRSERAMSSGLENFAAHRFELVDESSEYALATDEVLVLSIVVAQAPELVVPALKRSVHILSRALLEEGVPALFGQLLKRLRDIARLTGELELKAWVTGVANALPGD